MKSQGAAKNEANNAAQSGAAAPAETKVAEKVDFSNVKIEPIFEEMVDFDTFAKSDFRAVKILACEAVPKSKKLRSEIQVNATVATGMPLGICTMEYRESRPPSDVEIGRAHV